MASEEKILIKNKFLYKTSKTPKIYESLENELLKL